MEKKKKIGKQTILLLLGVVCLGIVAIFFYKSVEKTIVDNERENLQSLAKVNAQSLQSGLEAKQNLVYAVLSGDMTDEADIDRRLFKIREKGRYIPQEKQNLEEDWIQTTCAESALNPTEVLVGPIRQSNEGYYVLYMTKSVYLNGSLAGYVQIEWNLDEIYAEEQALSGLEQNERYCLIKDRNRVTVMPSNHVEEGLSFAHVEENGCVTEETYETTGGTARQVKKLIAYETLTIGDEELVLYIVEDYDHITFPIEQISLYLSLVGAAMLILAMWFIRKMSDQQKEEQILVRELQHEKMLNETMKKQEGLMQKYNHSKTMSVLTGSIAHEFNNLMTPIVLYTELLEENEKIYQEMPEEIEELKSATKRCAELARQLLGYSRQGKAEKILTEYDATFAMGEAVNIVQKLLPANVELKVSICKTPYYICGQLGALNQILLNLSTNAVHAMPDGGKLRIQFGLSTDDEHYVRLIVEDTGDGIPKEIRMKVFQPFFTTKAEGKGTGIGLTVVKRLTEEHGGNIRVMTEDGKGTKFILDFPRAKKEEERRPT